MNFKPACRAFAETAYPLQCSSPTVFFSSRSLQNLVEHFPIRFPNCPLQGPRPVIRTGLLCHAIGTGTFESTRAARSTILFPSSFPALVRTMSISPSSSACIGQSCQSSASAVPFEEGGATGPEESSGEDVIVQYIVIRKDLVEGFNWPLGSVISQGCHAAVAAIWLHKDDPVTRQYCAPDKLGDMHKVTLEVKGETQLRNLAQKLESGGIVHTLWIEQPENYATCLATKPYPKNEVASFFKKLKLFK